MRFSEKLCHLLQLPPRFLIVAIIFIAIAAHGQDKANSAAKIYYNGDIVTYDQWDGPEESERVEAAGVSPEGKISFLGTLGYVETEMKKKGFNYSKVSLEKMTLIPGFFDGHSHFVQVAYLPMFADMLPPPDGTVTTIKGIQESLIAHRGLKGKNTVQIGGREWEVVLGNGYDDSRLFGDGDSTKAPQGQPTRQQLDEVSRELEEKYKNKDGILICIFHQSGHYSVCNSKALSVAGITASSINPEGGTYYKDSAGQLTGLLGERAHVNMLLTVVPKLGETALLTGQDFYTSQGFTTVEDGRVSPDMVRTLSGLSEKLTVDVVAYPDLQMLREMVKKGHEPPTISRTYEPNGHYRTGGVKLTLDGSPQGRSAWFTLPYDKVPENEKADYRGEGNIGDDELKYLLFWAYGQNSWQVVMHANGDATIDQLIKAEREAQDEGTDRRTVLVHGQFLRADQIQKIKQYRIFPSLFPMHSYYWGDWYREIVGHDRADSISPTKSVQNADMIFSIHSDAPVTKPNSMRILDSAVNRTTRNGVLLGAKERISPIVALKAMTIWPAYQHFEEKTKGSIEAGKNADLVILSHNPLTVPHESLICIQVVSTIKNGKPVYENKDRPEEIGQKYKACAAEQARQKLAH